MTVKGEKPSVTIRLLRRQLSIAQATVKALQMDRADKEKIIAGYDVQLSEAQDETVRWQLTAEGQAQQMAEIQKAMRINANRLAYLEGYFYAKEKEAAFPPISAAGAPFFRHSAETHARRCEGDSPDIPDGRRREETPRQSFSPSRSMGRHSSQIRSERRDDPGNPRRQAVEHIEIKEPPF